MMTVLPLAKIGQVLNRPHYIQEAKKQVLLHIKYLADRKTGLWFHGWTFHGNHNVRPSDMILSSLVLILADLLTVGQRSLGSRKLLVHFHPIF